ncbi:uncharacterized protein LOC18439528 isoform X2 [Amborella trichopoda]|uniref:uncharacterized protein LOC18439528 isoform X2 n=1 Tax=Amborella trichopoda TaxID=13333 RepID=UPI0009BE8DF3|nr:uncharacterized protein LOC18439528 isoform X2 [Amborella trichopoda]|eukprot:XP_020526130.1 uncharacterized protein LOC18439528 isoform X2 [Amborella trichopoda]
MALHQRIIVVVEDEEVARTALQWAVHNIFRNGDFITLLHVFQPTTSLLPKNTITPSAKKRSKVSASAKERERLTRLKGFQLALSFKDLCNKIPEAKVDIIVTEGEEGPTIASLAKEIGASALILGLHDGSFLYSLSEPKGLSQTLPGPLKTIWKSRKAL